MIDKGYDVPALAKYLDWIAVMTYDYHGQWDKKTGHVAPLYYYPNDDYYYFNANYSINYWIAKGAPRRKIVMGIYIELPLLKTQIKLIIHYLIDLFQ